MEDRVAEVLDLAERILAEGRNATPEERARFQQLRSDLEGQSVPWKDRFADLVDRFAAALEGMGI